MDDGEHVLWRGAPDPAHTLRRWASDAAARYAVSVIGLVVFMAFAANQTGPSSLMVYIPAVVLCLGLLTLPLTAFRVLRRARSTSYVLTDLRLIVGRSSGETELRLANLPELRLEAKRDGFGWISFVPPAGAGPERYAQRWQRTFASVSSSELLGPVADVRRVYQLMRTAQAQPTPATGGEATTPSMAPAPPPPARTADVEAPVARLSFTESAASVPLWFSLIFLVVGLGTMTMAIVVGLGDGGIGVLLLGGFFALIGGALVRGRLRSDRARHRMQEGGRRLEGQVLDLAATGMRVNESEQWVVRYWYEVAGRTFIDQSPPMSWAQAAGWAAGDAIGILVDPEDPSKSVIAELVS